ncbi:hypothetical protein JR316_0007923 [Psilocybe cubensis]|uniref:Uncharacterized protein n=2 Tax=Psilocybe cubensis TaxID=181762 RepID=A0ACB8GUL9_PSICU|nr:hypothetical protein JR316_0007923 [Psilocybe cubensis]KAH9479333.1 hypothetical protein JR316_0007923 [Psilocybe cubensis]
MTKATFVASKLVFEDEEDPEYPPEFNGYDYDDSEDEFEDGDPAEKRPLYRFNAEENIWARHIVDSTITPHANPKLFAIATWNVDFSKNFLAPRLTTCLDHLQSHIEPLLAEDPPIPTIILIQELDCNIFETLLKHPFIQKHYDLTNISPAAWRHSYGSVTLVPSSMQVTSAFRSIFTTSRMGRDALYIDISFPADDTDDVQGNPVKVVRVANVHLESLDGHGDIERPRQLAIVASHLNETGVYGGIVGGDMNPIGPRDAAVPAELGFTDGWTACHSQQLGSESASTGNAPENTRASKVDRGNEESHTWGYQPRGRFPPCRMDKVLSIGNVKVRTIERIGVGLKVDPSLVQGQGWIWASDHYGLLAKVEVV